MKPKTLLSHRRDARTLVWSLGLFPLPFAIACLEPTRSILAFPLALYLGFCAGVLAHYHNHKPVFSSRVLNNVYSNWLGIFYGFPLFGWIPTHNRNHHKFTNGPGDATRTTKMKDDSIWSALRYPTLSSRWQWPALRKYIEDARRRSGYRAIEPFVQLATIVVFHGLFCWVLVALHGVSTGALSYTVLVLFPALFSSWSMMFTNYLQHVGCDPTSPDNHSRNFVGTWENWLVFDAGLHTVHHEHPGVHFSEYRALHAARENRIDPRLNERNMLTFLLRRYFSKSSREANANSQPALD